MTDVIVLGAGLAGLSAAAYAVQAGASVRLIAQGWGQQMIAPGWISVWDRGGAVAGAADYAAHHPDHPYALAGADALRAGLDAFCTLAESLGLPYSSAAEGANLRLPTLLGAVQTPAVAPRGFAQGDLTGISGPLLIVGFAGWRDFYPDLMAGSLSNASIAARALTIDAPAGTGSWDAWPGDLARRFDDAAFRQSVIAQVRPRLQGAVKVGFPAVLGLEHPAAVLDELERALGCSVFEIATLPPSMPGVRLSAALRRWLLRQRVRVQIGHPVLRGLVENGRCTGVEVGALGHTNIFRADHIILATGGLYNGGIQSDLSGRVWEPLFGLPVSAPPGEGRTGWTADCLLSADGHPIHRVGLRVDAAMCPLSAEGAPALTNVFAAGQVIGGVNALVDGCAEGVALATAWRAVRSALGA